MKRVIEREEDDEKESMNGEETRAHAMFTLLLMVEAFFCCDLRWGLFFFLHPLC